jgi:Holliday junction resolvase
MQWSPFRSKTNAPEFSAAKGSAIAVAWNKDGVEFRAVPARKGWLGDSGSFGADAELALLLGQLEEEGYAEVRGEAVCLAWQDFYRVAASNEHGASVAALKLPPVEQWRPALSSKETLIDEGFAVSIAGWLDPQGLRPQGNVAIEGAVIKAGNRVSILPESAWRVVESVAQFWARPSSERAADSNRRAWSAIRSHAASAGADMTDFLRKTVVLTPERLRMGMRKGDVGGASMVELQPSFDGAPDRWLEIFDRIGDVPERYDIPDGHGIVHVMLAPEVRTVLREIRRMPGRRIAGDRAEAFLRNPFATLGPDAAKVIDPEQFEKARDDAGVSFARFTARVLRDEKGYPYEMALMVEESIGGEVRSDELRFEGAHDLEKFVAKLEARIAASAQCCHWQGYDLEILGDTPDQAKTLREALRDMAAPGAVKASEIFDLSKYSDRVEGFGVEKPYYSPFITRKGDDSGWFPENVDFGLCYTPEGGGETVAVVLNEDSMAAFREEASKAQAEKRETFDFPGCPKPVPVKWANDALDAIGNARADVAKREFDPNKPATKAKASERKGLVVKPNVDTLDYEERRGALAPTGAPPKLPASLRPEIALKEHQLSGVAWLQHLWSLSPTACRGALLADDMGLGKTIQLLTFIAAAIEEKPDIDPFLIVAPVSLLENWKEEIAKFFAPGAMRVLTLYGPSLAEKRVPKRALEEELVRGGATRLLVSGWLGDAQVVLTTYETLRDLEFSLAAQRWSAMICDEAQKIKNPNALVTRAAKKQNARLKIACTGTPVENTLTDIWCLFDFVQPGLLGALKEFGNRYRRPIEAETDEEKERVAELKALIEPQKLRRTKAEVAKDLPKKIEVDSCRALPLSDRQRAHYADAVAAFRKRDKSGPASGLQSPLGLLQYLRRLCSDPRPPGQVSTDSEPLSDIERRSPKMAWLMGQLREIEAKGEKVIVFCEFRDLQRTLQRCIGERFGVVPDVINGDTSADSANANNRQRRIKKFQEKPGFGVIVLSPLAVGFGVNIQAANHVVHFTRTWNPAKEDQATDRAYRIGQTKEVHVYYPVVVAHDFLTFDAKLDKLLDWKRGLSTDMLNGSGDVSPADFGDLEAPDGGNAFGNELLGADDIRSMDPDAFEALCALLWSKRGYPRTIKTPRSGDGGVDVVAIRGAEGVLIQCKSSSVEGRELGWEAVKDVAAGVGAYAQRHPGVSFSMVAATNQRFNGTARQQAQILRVELVDGDDLESLLAKHPVKRGELERFLLANWMAA